MSVSVHLPEDVAHRLHELAHLTGRTQAFLMREAIREYLADLEDYYLAEKAMEDIEAGRSKTYSLEEMVQRLGLED